MHLVTLGFQVRVKIRRAVAVGERPQRDMKWCSGPALTVGLERSEDGVLSQNWKVWGPLTTSCGGIHTESWVVPWGEHLRVFAASLHMCFSVTRQTWCPLACHGTVLAYRCVQIKICRVRKMQRLSKWRKGKLNCWVLSLGYKRDRVTS